MVAKGMPIAWSCIFGNRINNKHNLQPSTAVRGRNAGTCTIIIFINTIYFFALIAADVFW